MKKSPLFTPSVLSQAVALACLSITSMPAVSEPPPSCGTSLSGTNLPGCTMDTDNASLDINSGASITDPTGWGFGVSVDADVGSLTNNGIIDIDSRFGIRVSSTGSVAGGITNNGLIDIGPDNTSNYGIYLESTSVAGGLTNTGTIEVDSTSASTAMGVLARYSTIDGGVSNSGTISAETDYYDTYNYAYGLYLESSTVNGEISNSGLIEATANASGSDGYAYAYGLYLDNTTVTGGVANSGTISVNAVGPADSGSDYAYGYGLYMNSTTVAGSVTNSGTISVTADARASSGNDYTYAYAYGLYLDASTVGGDVVNNGLIQAEVNASSGYNNAWGLSLYETDIAGNVTNNGTIAAIANGFGTGYSDYTNAYGLFAYDADITGDITNNGTIMATNDQNADYANAYGLYLYSSDVAGDVVNNGLIDATAINDEYSANAVAFYLYDTDVVGDVVNTGTISATADNPNGWANAEGFVISSSIVGNVTNDGVISATADGGATTYGATAEGLSLYGTTVNGNVTNNGTIMASASSTGTAPTTNAAWGVYIDSTTISGDLVNNGLISAEAMGVNATALGLYVGTGASIGAITNNGTIIGGIDVDSANDVGVTNAGLISTNYHNSLADDDYTQTADGVFRMSVMDTGTYGDLTVNGAATFAAGSGISVEADPANTLADGDVLADVVSAGTLSASTFTVTDNVLPFSFDAIIDGTTVDLTAVSTGLTTIAAATTTAGLSAGAGAAGVLDTLIAADPGGEIAFAFGNMSTAQEVADAVDSVLPALSGGLGQATHGIASAVTGIVGGRQDAMSGVSSGDGYLADKHFWLKPFGGWTDQDRRQGVTGYDIDSYGIAFGMDGDVSSSTNVGVAFAVIESDVESDVTVGDHEVDVSTILGKIYATYRLDDVTSLNMQAGYGMSDNDSSRRIFTGAVAAADYDSTHFQLNAELSRNYQMDAKTNITPYVHADYSYVEVDSYTETGAGGFNLVSNDDDTDSLIIGIGVKGSYASSDNLLLTGDAGIGYDTQTERSRLTSSFAGGGAVFTTRGMEPDEIVYNLGLGAKYSLENDTEVTTRYDFNGRDDYTDQAVSVNVRWNF